MFEAETPAPAPTSPIDAPTQTATPAAGQQYPFRLLKDETVLGMYPVSRMRRPLGKLVSYLFVTDSRVVFSAEAKTISSSSTLSREFHVDTVKGIEVERDKGLDSLALAATVGVALNIIISLVLCIISANVGNSSDGYYGSSSPTSGLALLFGLVTFASVVIGVIAFLAFRNSRTATLTVVGPNPGNVLTGKQDLLSILFRIVIFLIFGPFALIGVIFWFALRELGVVRAADAGRYVHSDNLDRISYEAGALILDVQARGKLAGQ